LEGRRESFVNELDSIEMDELRTLTHSRSGPITSVSVSKGFAFMSVRPRDDAAQEWGAARLRFLERLAERGISVEMLQFAPLRVRFIVPEGTAAPVREVVGECELAWRLVPHCCKVSLVGAGIRTTAGVFYRALTALMRGNIPLLHFSDSNVTMSLIVPEEHGHDAESLLHEVLFVGGDSSFSTSISFDALLGRVRVNGQERRLGARQAKLLAYLIENVGRVVESEEAARHLFGTDGKEEVAALRVHMHNLRKKIEEDPDNPRYIVTIPAQGYLFVR
jgi:Transcriptional regulatory protein, C terminal